MDVQIIDSTISGNVAGTVNGAAFVFANIAVKLYNSTVTNNAAAPTRNGGIAFSTGPTAPATGSNALPGTLMLVSSIVARSQGGAPDIGINTTTIPAFTIDAAQSLVGIICGTCGITGAGNLTGVDPLVGPLAYNGGPTRTHALLFNSPAINAGSNPLSLTSDQRGPAFPRVVGAAADMGAFEYIPGLAPVLQGARSRKVHGGAGAFDLPLAP